MMEGVTLTDIFVGALVGIYFFVATVYKLITYVIAVFIYMCIGMGLIALGAIGFYAIFLGIAGVLEVLL